MPKTLYDQLCEAAKVVLQVDETFEDFAKRAANKINKFSQEKWDDLPNSLQHWVNNTLEAVDKGQTLPALAGYPAHDPDTGEVNDDDAVGGEAAAAESSDGDEPAGDEAVDDAPAVDDASENAPLDMDDDGPAPDQEDEPVARRKTTKKAVAKKAAVPVEKERVAKKPVAKKAGKAAADFSEGSKIRVLVKGNPYREGSGRFKRWAKLKDGMTVAQALKVGFAPVNLRYCVADGHIKIVKAA
jgi:hypothetical protein